VPEDAATRFGVSGLANGGGATMYAAEHDVDGWADGYVAAEPQAQIRSIGASR